MIDIFEGPIYSLVIGGLYILNALLLCGIAALMTDPRLDWHDYIYPASVGAGLLVSIELLAFNWWARRRDSSNITSSGWVWIFAGIFLFATIATWIWTFDKHQSDWADLMRAQAPPPPMVHLDSHASEMLQNFRAAAPTRP